jgi:hypothetical protein
MPAMLRLLGSPRLCCDGLTRRETLAAGCLTAVGGLGLAELLQAKESAGSSGGKAKSVIVLYLLGGAATQDMFDLKPAAPAEIRGEFAPIDTSAPGIQICEHLPQMARWMHKAAIVRSVNHKGGCHNPIPSYTGYEQPVDNLVDTRDGYPPSMGSVCEYLRQQGGRKSRDLPDYVYMPCYLGWGQNIRRPGPYGGFLGHAFDALTTECQPTRPEGAPEPKPGHPQPILGMPQLAGPLPEGVTIDRLDSRRRLLDQIDEERCRLDLRGPVETYGRNSRKAFDLLTSSETRSAFDLSDEPPELVERYGRTLFGHSALMARRLVERGVRLVNVTWDLFWDRVKVDYDAWDTHTRNFAILKENRLPPLDQTWTALIGDLDARGLLDETLVVVMSEMGRTPRINSNAGRDHWTYCYSVLFAGGGIRGGTVFGQSDADAAYVKSDPVSTGDVCATIFHALGIDPSMTVPDQLGRPVSIAHGGTPIRDIL